jgi:hypothetical protein
MLNFCGIVVAILKMETGRNFWMSGINSGHHNLPTYEILLKSNNVEVSGRFGRLETSLSLDYNHILFPIYSGLENF